MTQAVLLFSRDHIQGSYIISESCEQASGTKRYEYRVITGIRHKPQLVLRVMCNKITAVNMS